MATIESKIIKLETPTSESDSNYEEFEFMLAWYDRNGAYMNYLFTDWARSHDVNATVINVQDSDVLSNIIGTEQRTVKVVAEDLTLNDLEAVSSILVAKKIIRVYKDGTTERIGLERNSFAARQTDGRYNLEFDIILYELPLAK